MLCNSCFSIFLEYAGSIANKTYNIYKKDKQKIGEILFLSNGTLLISTLEPYESKKYHGMWGIQDNETVVYRQSKYGSFRNILVFNSTSQLLFFMEPKKNRGMFLKEKQGKDLFGIPNWVSDNLISLKSGLFL